ncbi:MAG: two-component system response regulator [Pseudanabaena frigida]|uniref:Two-component system response regulator n=1 Tax=Pseudanabaena frigida TaxID=945775 RepID=A0A2W4WCI1_9CYAN|nr:MAG: two-component system response regulator [Pseudanabaena frigida]
MRSFDPILLVEDDQLDVMTLKRALKEIKATNPLHIRNNGEAALEFLRDPANPKPLLILLDLNMPRMNGLEFLEIIKADVDLCKIPVVVLTTSQEEQDRLASFQLSVAGYIIKPLTYPDFVEKLLIVYQYWCLSEIPDLMN